MTAYTEGRQRDEVQSEVRLAIHRTIIDGDVALLVPRINGVAMLNDSLNLATLPPAEQLSTQFTHNPTFVPVSDPPTQLPTSRPTDQQSQFPTTRPTFAPVTVPQTQPPLETPITVAPTESLTAIATTPQLITATPTLTVSETLSPVAGATFSVSSRAPTTESPLASEGQLTQTQPDISIETLVPGTAPPITTSTARKYYKEHNRTNALEKVPIWGWVLIALGICIICTYTDPDDDDQHEDIACRTAMDNHAGKDQQANQSNEEDTDREAFRREAHDGNLEHEYLRKLYRQ